MIGPDSRPSMYPPATRTYIHVYPRGSIFFLVLIVSSLTFVGRRRCSWLGLPALCSRPSVPVPVPVPMYLVVDFIGFVFVEGVFAFSCMLRGLVKWSGLSFICFWHSLQSPGLRSWPSAMYALMRSGVRLLCESFASSLLLPLGPHSILRFSTHSRRRAFLLLF